MSQIKILLLIPFFYFYSYANDINISSSKLNLISNDKTWHKLLHIKDKKSEILSSDFFITNKSKNNPKDELIETITSYNSTKLTKDNTHPLCKYPARYLWLSKKIDFMEYKVPEYCTNLKKWDVYKNTQSISLMLVSGYLGNPASTFGHSFIKLNSKEVSQNDLFDLSINYGALVPQKEPIIKYIFKGIFGGYEAGFSDKYFYTQDLIYSHNEFRDMWNYKLNLSQFEEKLIIFHLWEILGKKFKYYFLDKNCAYRGTQILELVRDEPLIINANNWYAPVETFHKLEELNRTVSIIKDIEYIPSSQKIIYAKYNLLSKNEKKFIIKVINSDYKNIQNKLAINTIKEQINILDFLLSYEKYLLIKNPKLEKKKEIKNKLLFLRLQLPVKQKESYNIKKRVSPAKGNKPMIIGTGITHLSKIGTYPTLDFTVFAIEALGQNSLNFDELIVANTSLAYKKNFFINEFNLIKIKKLNKTYLDWEEDFNPSWKLNIGSKAIQKNTKITNDIFVKGSIGKSFKISERINSYLMVETSIHSKLPYIRAKPNINFDLDLNKFKNSLELGYEMNLYNKHTNEYIKLSSQYKISDNFSAAFIYENSYYSKLSLNLKWFF